MSRQSSSASLSAAVAHAASPFHASFVFAAVSPTASAPPPPPPHALAPSPPHTHTALARGFTAHDVDAAEALSTLAHPHTAARARAHTVGHDATGYTAHTHTHGFGAYTATHAAPTHTHQQQHAHAHPQQQSAAMRYSAPAALHGTGTGTGTGTHASTATAHTHHHHQQQQQHAYYATDAAAAAAREYHAHAHSVLQLNATRTGVTADERHAMRRALVQATTLQQAQAQNSLGVGVGLLADGGGSGSGNGGGSARRLVESPSGKPCPNCHASTSTLWRSCALLSGQHYLCNACGLRFKKGKYCPLCTRVYYDADTHAGAFKQCTRCGTWTHKQCLARIGALAPDDLREQSPFERAPPYTCTRCNGGVGGTSASASLASSRTDDADSDAGVDRMQF